MSDNDSEVWYNTKVLLLYEFSLIYANMSRLKLFGLSLGSIGLLLLNTILWQSPWCGGLFLFVYSIVTSLFIGKSLFASFPRISRIVFGFLVLLSEIIIAGTGIYYLYQITPFISFLLLLAPLATPFLFSFLKIKPLKEKSIAPLSKESKLLAVSITLLDIFLLAYLFIHRTYDLAASPWQSVSALFFVFYFLTTLLLFYSYSKIENKTTTYLITSLHVFVGLSIAALIYPLGYGFDAFIHRATEQWIFDHGFILPKTPYYIGQYSLVVMLAHVSALPLRLIDIYLVPVLASILMPTIIMQSLESSFPNKKKSIPFLFWLVIFIPFLFFHLTTPHNIVVLFTLLSVFLLLMAVFEKISVWALFLVALAAIATHALVGVPLFVFIFFFFVTKNIKNLKLHTISLILFVLTLAALLPLMFTLNALRNHAPLPHVENPLLKLSSFMQIFDQPYWYAKTSPWYFEILYFCEQLIVPMILILSGVGSYFLNKDKKNRQLWIFTTAFLGFTVSAFTLASSIVFPDVVSYEQNDYPRRLLYVSILFLLPAAMYGADVIAKKIQSAVSVEKKKQILLGLTLVLLSVTFTCILYLSYPQRNVKVRFPGYNVTSADVKAVEWIHARHNDYNYIVLANQLVSAAALDKYSFAKYFQTKFGELFYYAVPTGGKLYEYYGAMIYKAQKHEYMDEAMDLVGVDTAYFVVDRYWANSDKIILGGMATADEYYPIEDGKVWVFVYKKK